jgi:uncharacterized protein YkwD
MFSLANQDRIRNGLMPFRFNCELLDIARARAADQIVRGALSHRDSDGAVIAVRLIHESNLSYQLIAENLAHVGGPTEGAAAIAARALMESPGHRANILNPNLVSLTVGAAANGEGQIVFAQIFVTP